MTIALIDYGAGNLRSVANALGALGITPRVVGSPGQLAGATHVVMPGVGSFGDCMNELAARNLVEPLRDWAAAGKPYFGICLGYQILFEGSEETPDIAGFGVLRGQVRRFQEKPGIKIPHMGWNSVIPRQPDAGFWRGLGAEPYFYYVHSYFPAPADESAIAAETCYGSDTFAAAVQKGPLLAVQFHPEKSQDAGLRLLGNFFDATF
jgi:glutamine amidotransferase